MASNEEIRTTGQTERKAARRHHTVPRFYLRGFAENDQIGTVRLHSGRRFVQSVSDASVVKNFYSIEEHPDGPDAIEIALSEIESKTDVIFNKIKDGVWPLSETDRMTLGYFVSLQATRIPSRRKASNVAAREVLRLMALIEKGRKSRHEVETQRLKEPKDALVRLTDDASYEEIPQIELPNSWHVGNMINIADKIHRHLVGRPWMLVEFRRRSLFTSDVPVSLIPEPYWPPDQGVGFATARGIAFPVTRRLGLLMSSPEPLIEQQLTVDQAHVGKADMRRQGTTSFERFFNGNTAIGVNVFIFHHPQDHFCVSEWLASESREGDSNET